MSIRLDPRRLAALKLLAAEAGVRPGELVTLWVEERLDAARRGESPAAPATDGKAIAALSARVDDLVKRLDALAAAGAPATPAPADVAAPSEPTTPAPKRRGRPPKAATGGTASTSVRKPRSKSGSAAPRIPLHEEIAAIIAEQGPMSAVQLAAAITERGRYTAPRTTKPLDAATVSARVSNPVYRSRFVRRQGLISLASTE